MTAHVVVGTGQRLAQSDAIDAGYAGQQARLLNAIIARTQPGDVAYARAMERIYTLAQAAQALHVRMVECYEDGFPKRAAKYARLTAECGYEMSDLHAEIAAAFDSIVTDGHSVDVHDRYASNVPEGEIPADTWNEKE